MYLHGILYDNANDNDNSIGSINVKCYFFKYPSK